MRDDFKGWKIAEGTVPILPDLLNDGLNMALCSPAALDVGARPADSNVGPFGRVFKIVEELASQRNPADASFGIAFGIFQPSLLGDSHKLDRTSSKQGDVFGGLIGSHRAPIVVEYRLNAGYLPLDHWVHSSQGGGRNIGEACHMYDVFRFLAGAPASSIQATSIDPGALPYRRNDNFSATIGYENGSLGHLLYTSLGPNTGLGKERIEIYCDGETYVVDDFKRLIKGSDGSVLWQSSEADKGHFEELSRFGDRIASGGPSPIPFDELVETSAVALQVEDLLLGRPAGDEA